jgi:type I restriction enzyme S subunit
MEVKPGYKQTEVGVIPEEWEVQTGEQITTLIGKGGSPRWQGFEYSNGGMLFVTSENVRDGFLDIREPKYLPLAFHEKLKRTKLQKHDILVNLVGASIGRSCKIQQDLGEANVNQAVAVFRVKDQCSSAFLACCFQAPTTIERILEMQVDAARPNISLGDLRRFLIQFPPLPEQHAIAEALSDVDGLLDGLDRLIVKKRDLKQAAMQQLLTGQTRLPGFHGEWEVKRLGELANIRMCKRIFAEQTYTSGEIPFFKIGTFGKEPDAFITESLYDEYRNKYSFPAKGDILLSAAGTLGKTVIYDGQPAYFQDSNIVWLEINKTLLCNEFLNYCYQVIAWASPEGSTIPRLYNGIIRDSAVSLPPLPEQTAIAEVLTEMDRELAALEQRREKTRALKQAMMQELLTGRIRLV